MTKPIDSNKTLALLARNCPFMALHDDMGEFYCAIQRPEAKDFCLDRDDDEQYIPNDTFFQHNCTVKDRLKCPWSAML